MSRLLVLKFGGTSVSTPARIRRAASRVHAHVRRGRRVVVVVSARGGTTDRLLRTVAALGPPAAAQTVIDGRIDGGSARGREVDRLLATGEDRSAALLAIALWARGVPARSLRGGEAGVRAEGAFGGGSIRHIATARLRRVLERGIVPIVSGFQGERTDGETVTLGRGASDTSAVALAAALRADCHVITDVAGVYDHDPRKHADARRLEQLTHEELVALADGGAQVMHPAAANLAAFASVPLRIYHHRAPLSGRGGTLVGVPDHTPAVLAAPLAAPGSSASGGGAADAGTSSPRPTEGAA